jgi:hypothetical protein
MPKLPKIEGQTPVKLFALAISYELSAVFKPNKLNKPNQPNKPFRFPAS